VCVNTQSAPVRRRVLTVPLSLKGSFRKLDEENASLSAQLLDKSSQLVANKQHQPGEDGGVSEKQLKKIAAKFEKRVAALASQRDAALHTARTSTEHLSKAEAELENAHAELRALRAEIVRMQALANSTTRETQALDMLRAENRSLRSEHSDITARLEALHRMLDISTRASAGDGADSTSELEVLRKRLSEAEVKAKQHAKESEDAQARVLEVTRQRDSLALLMKRAQADAKDASAKLNLAEEELAEERAEAAELRGQVRYTLAPILLHPYTLNPYSESLKPQSSTLSPQPSTLNPQPSTVAPYSNPQTLNTNTRRCAA
jgi:DNA repair exonuclease SbcCD ATPase subunit